MSTNMAGPGWFADPEYPGYVRYWDGTRWTDHRAPAAAPPMGQAFGVAPANSSQATTSLVLGILSLVFLGFLTGIPAMVIGRKATREIDESGGRIGGRGMATAGFVTGLIGTLWSGLLFLLVVGVFIFGGIVASTTSDTICTSVSPDPFSNPECFD